ncbi:MAG: hypothetical protein B7Z31_10250 [Rhodobacterales bacterium 12-65-15]|nr:MAG: hypothetical protein B7Z31_10250 [Rhodobacterales bacterium 12-65-15]
MPCLSRLALAVALTLPAAAHAQDLATGAEIAATLTGNTVQGSMLESGAYTEFYAADGTIKGADYTGTWTVEGDTMCFSYGDAPDCWNVRIKGEAVTWVQDDEDGGTGTIVKGNPNNF